MRARRAITIIGGAAAVIVLWAVPALASDHLADATNAPGAGQRDAVRKQA